MYEQLHPFFNEIFSKLEYSFCKGYKQDNVYYLSIKHGVDHELPQAKVNVFFLDSMS